MRRQSRNRRLEATVRLRVTLAAFERDGYVCYLKGKDAGKCMGPLVGHERISRARYPGGHLDVDNVITLCACHNQWVEDNPAAALANGAAKNSWEHHPSFFWERP